MAEYPALPLWTDAYLGDTSHLTTIEHGAYLLILIAMWRAGGALPNDDKRLARTARLTPGQWGRVKESIWEFFTVSSDSITQGRLTDELNAVRQNSKKQSDKAKARWLKKNKTTNAGAMPEECRSDASLTLTHIHESPNGDSPPLAPQKPDRFEEFWGQFPRQRRGNKAKAMKAYQAALAEGRATEAEILAGVAAYARSDEVQRGFGKGAQAWLNDDRWASDYRSPPVRAGPQHYNDHGTDTGMSPTAESFIEDVYDREIGRPQRGSRCDGPVGGDVYPASPADGEGLGESQLPDRLGGVRQGAPGFCA